MENNIKTLRIQNFKSIKDVTMTPRRVNLIIGMPNVGKSNILEAIGLLGAGLYESGDKFMSDTIRYEVISNLFYDNDISEAIVVESSQGIALLKAGAASSDEYKSVQIGVEILEIYKNSLQKDRMDYQPAFNVEKLSLAGLLDDAGAHERYGQDAISEARRMNIRFFLNSMSLNESGSSRNFSAVYSDVNILPKSYVFKHRQLHHQRYRFSFLQPPFGSNLLDVVQRNKKLRQEIANLFKPYGLQMVLRVNDRKFEIQKNIDDFVYNYPYSSIADTLQRIIFYLASIESNDDAVILLEEPEAHSYPVYVSMLGQRIAESRNNQFFVATHSPYLITEVLEQMLPNVEQAQELAIFVAYYEGYQTKVKQLSDEEVRAIRADGLDVFYNMDRFVPSPANG
jgi:AAA15 family ATPase/GTPase